MKKKISIIVIFLIGIFFKGYSQEVPGNIIADSIPETVQIFATDVRMDILMDKKVMIVKTGNKISSTKTVLVDRYGRVNMPGFRLQVINSTDRSLIYATKAKLYQQFPTHNQYVIAQAPFFKLRFGNFVTKAEAEKYRKILAPMFPNGVYVVSDIIESRVKLEKKTEAKSNEKIKKEAE